MTRSTVKSLAKEIADQLHKKNGESLEGHTVRQALEYYDSTKTDIKPSTRKNKKMLLAQLESRGFADKPIVEMTGAVIREFLTSLKLSDNSTHQIYLRLQTVLNYYIKEHNLKISLQKGLIKGAPPKKSEEDEFLTWVELQNLFATQPESENDRFYIDLFCLMGISGMAIADLLKFDPAKSVQDKWLKYVRVKTGSECLIPLLPMAQAIISSYTWPIKISRRMIQHKCSKLISQLVGRKIKSHGGRKTFGAVMLELNFSMEAVSKMMGHSNPNITAKLYAKIGKDKIDRELNNLPSAIKEMMGI